MQSPGIPAWDGNHIRGRPPGGLRFFWNQNRRQRCPGGQCNITGDAIIARPAADEYKVYSTVCPHQGSPITQVSGDTVKCTRHGSVFSIKDGSVISGPSQAGLSPKEFSKDGDSIVVK